MVEFTLKGNLSELLQTLKALMEQPPSWLSLDALSKKELELRWSSDGLSITSSEERSPGRTTQTPTPASSSVPLSATSSSPSGSPPVPKPDLSPSSRGNPWIRDQEKPGHEYMYVDDQIEWTGAGVALRKDAFMTPAEFAIWRDCHASPGSHIKVGDYTHWVALGARTHFELKGMKYIRYFNRAKS